MGSGGSLNPPARPGELRPGSTRGRARSASALCGARGWRGAGGASLGDLVPQRLGAWGLHRKLAGPQQVFD